MHHQRHICLVVSPLFLSFLPSFCQFSSFPQPKWSFAANISSRSRGSGSEARVKLNMIGDLLQDAALGILQVSARPAVGEQLGL